MGLESERLKHQGRLAEAKQKARELELRIEGDIRAIRDLLDPFAMKAEIRADVAAAQAVEMAAKHAEYCGLLEEIKAIETALGV